MRRFFRKRLPAFLLTLVMVMTMVPAVSARSSADIEYEVDAGDNVTLELSAFKNYYSDNMSDSLERLEFTDLTGVDANGKMYAVNSDGDEVRVDEDDMLDAWFYVSSSDVDSGDYWLKGMNYTASSKADGETAEMKFTMRGDNGGKLTGTLCISIGGASKSGTISYSVKSGSEATFDAEDFNSLFRKSYSSDMRYVQFDRPSKDYTSAGTIYSNYDRRSEESFDRFELNGYKFYYSDGIYGDYDLDDLSFVAEDDYSGTLSLTFTIYGNGSKSVDGTLKITIGKSGNSSTSKGDITYTVKAGEEVAFDDDDFKKIYENSSCTGSFKYVEFSRPDSAFNNAGTLYFRYGKRDETAFTRSSLSGNKFYYGDSDYGDYDLDELSFVADKSFSGSVELNFTVYGGTGTRTNQNATGTLVITTGTSAGTSRYVGNIRYNTTPGTALQINANDIARLFRKYTSGEALQYLTLTSVPATGSLYYNYYNTSKYGSAQMPLTASTAGNVVFSYSPASASEYDLSELTYIPSGSNYCTSLGFTGYSSNGTTVSATILISVTASPVSEVYSVTTKGTSVNFPANSVYSAVASATGFGLSSIQLLELPASTAGVLYVGSYAADTTSAYSYGNGTDSMGQLRFIPNSKFTGSVSIPYVALSSSGTALGAGVVSIGVVDSVKKFTDISTSTWCYKYVTELASANVISGYSNGTFQEKNTITYGAALKLIMLAAGYSEQAPTVKGSTFSGYLAKAKADGLVSGNPKLNGPITRLQIAQIAAKALKLSTTGLPSKKPFTDTNDVYVQALNAAGIIEGYFSNGTSTYKPNNTLTRGQVSAIVWRMKNSV